MTTRREMGIAARTDFHMLNKGWRELFNSGTRSENEGRAVQDMYHIPSGLADLISGVIGEGIEYVNAFIDAQNEEGTLVDEEDQYNAAMNGILTMSRLLANRMYQLGQHMATRAPYANLTPCPCSVLVDDELEDFLAIAAHEMRDYKKPLKGDGFEILNWDPNKKPE